MSSNLQRTLQAKRTYPIDMHAVHIMGILNITPDSFYPASRLQHLDQVLLHAQDMVQAGATILDIGGESTRPGAVSVPIEEETEPIEVEIIEEEKDVEP